MQISQSTFSEKSDGRQDVLIRGSYFNVCKYLKKPQLDPFLRISLQISQKYGLTILSCPILKVWFFFEKNVNV